MIAETASQPFTLSKLVAEYRGGIRIPMIQRDYAQGRPSWANSRKRFLVDLKNALCEENLLHLDFVYGVEQEEDSIPAFCPLDGQQRLTTLFLLHWYLAARDGCFGDFQATFRTSGGDSRFSYQVRPGGRSFFEALVNRAPDSLDCQQNMPSRWIHEQPWFRTIWMLDPTVSGALVMLDAIHAEFQDSAAGYRQLVNGGRITFQRFDLNAAGLHDDLYLRMNARGRPLSTFETFKARFGKHLEFSFPDSSALSQRSVGTAREFSDRIDTIWLDFIWERYGPGIDASVRSVSSDDTLSIDAAFINLFRAVALVSLPNEKVAGKDDPAVTFLSKGEPDYDDFEKGRWLGPLFTNHLICLLEALTGAQAAQILALIDPPWFDRGSLLDRIVRHGVEGNLTHYLQFAATVRFLAHHRMVLDETSVACFHDWMRVIRNLVINTEVRSDSFRKMLTSLDQLLEGSGDIQGFLAGLPEGVTFFEHRQFSEERLKASLMLADSNWRPLLNAAEDHDYFRGQIDFLLEFSGVNAPEGDPAHTQGQFSNYWRKAESMFDSGGLLHRVEKDYLWERSLLAVGDYLLDCGSARSFLGGDRSSRTSWKRLLKEGPNGRRGHLKELWDRMASESLERIAADLPAVPWHRALIINPAAWAYCQQSLIRIEQREAKPPRIFLLSSRRRRASYAELFTFCLQEQESLKSNPSRFTPLEFKGLIDHTGSGDDPHLLFQFQTSGNTHSIKLYCQHGNDAGYSLWAPATDLNPRLDQLLQKAGFATGAWGNTDYLIKRQEPADPLVGAVFLDSVAADLKQQLIHEQS